MIEDSPSHVMFSKYIGIALKAVRNLSTKILYKYYWVNERLFVLSEHRRFDDTECSLSLIVCFPWKDEKNVKI
jgi:hypothetical protein